MDNNKPYFIIIGAGGFIGSAFSNYLKKKGIKVLNILRGQISGVEADFNFITEEMKTEEKNLLVVDFAYTSVPNSSFKDPVKDYSENLYNVIRHLELVKQLPKATYIYISSGGTVYGNPLNHQPIHESHTNIPLSPYGITKLACEKYVLMYKEIYGLNIKIVRPSNIYGPGQLPFRGQGLIATAIAKIFRNESIQIFGNGSQVRDYLYITDFCNALHDIIYFGSNGEIYNIGYGVGYTINELLDNIKIIVDLPIPTDYLPFRPFDVHYNVLDSTLTKSLNDWCPSVSLHEGLKETIKWIKFL